MKIERLQPGRGIRSNAGTMGVAAVTLIRDGDQNILVDVGHFGGRDELLQAMRAANLQPRDIDTVVLTHIHWDHCINVDLFDRATILAGRDELRLGYMMGIKDGHTRYFKELLKKIGVRSVKDGEKVSDNSRAVLTPGHSPGHVAVSIKEDDGSTTVIAGDAIPNYRAYLRNMPDLIFYNKSDARASVTKIKKMKPSMIIPGHDSPFNDKGYLLHDEFNLILRRETEENSIITLKTVPADKPVDFT
ncbi:MAG: MBL fold metallo-hydrolase [Thaumarchaeota archaeon]|nr:MBL fold metallo-hydrolase [Nitrososphaerota archaeon]